MSDELVEQLRFLGMDDAADEIERLRSLITDVIDAEDDLDGHPSDYHENVSRAWNALCEAVGR